MGHLPPNIPFLSPQTVIVQFTPTPLSRPGRIDLPLQGRGCASVWPCPRKRAPTACKSLPLGTTLNHDECPNVMCTYSLIKGCWKLWPSAPLATCRSLMRLLPPEPTNKKDELWTSDGVAELESTEFLQEEVSFALSIVLPQGDPKFCRLHTT